MKIYKVIYSPQAIYDLNNIYIYLSVECSAPQQAKSQISRIRKSIRSLEIMPLRNSIVDEYLKVYKSIVNHYCILYLVNESLLEVQVIRVFHQSRDLKLILQKYH